MLRRTSASKKLASFALCVGVLAGSAGARIAPVSAQSNAPAAAIDRALLDAYKWRSIGPARGGRSIAASGVKGRPNEAYFGAVGGGLWKTIDAGNHWRPVTDGQIGSSSVGAVAVSESNPDIVYIGMGESCIRGNIMPGDGVYKSADAGKTWTKLGFADSDAIARVRIHPSNPDIVFVASFGRYGVPSDERGVFKSVDGGKTWQKVLFRDNRTGAVDLSIDGKNPQVMYASLWEAYRVEYQMSSGGPGSGLFKSVDGGDTWQEITRNAGLPEGVVGRIGVAVSGADSNRVYALVENANGGLFSSDDAGATWKLVNDNRTIRQRAFYYTHVHADPNNKDVVYMLNTSAFRSTDGGKTMTSIGTGTHGDHHDMWIDPDNSEHVMLGNDGGGAISYNVSARERTWSGQEFSTAQFYHVSTTAHLPFHVCGSQQDNSSLCVPSDTGEGGVGAVSGGFGRIPPVAPYPVGGGEPGYIAPHPTDPDVFFAGANNGTFLTRHNRRTGELKEVGAYPRFFSGEPSSQVKERWQWTYPIIYSPIDPKVLYTSSQRVWKTTDDGQTWEAISADLSRHDPKTMQESGGPITHDMNSPEIYGTVFSLAPGKTDVNVIWAGSDDGLVHVTRDGGKTWTNITPPDMPEFGRVSQIDSSKFDAGTAYIAVKKMLLGDLSPHIFRTHDYGKSWTKIVAGIATNDYTHAVREDATRRGLLYAGTQHGFYISFDDGDRWLPFKQGLPDTQVSDIWVEDNDIAIATHGRGFYILDNIAALRQVDATTTANAQLFKPVEAIRGAQAARIDYWLPAEPKSLTLEIRDGQGQVVRSYPGVPPKPPAGAEGEAAPPAEEEGPRRPPTSAPMTAGLNRFTWDLMSEPVVSFPGMVLWGATTNGPMVLPGTYEVRLLVDGRAETQPLLVKQHPLRPVGDADLQAQYQIGSQIRDKVNEANNAVITIRRMKDEVAKRLTKANTAEAKELAARLTKNLSAVEEDVYQVRNRSNQDPLNFPIKINNRLASLLRVVNTGEGRPTSNVLPIFNDVVAELKVQTDRLAQVVATDLATFNRMMQRMKIEPIESR
ncbi:MAG: glycosyl hydrolase [Acidobacteria bacterium]|nr:glycosyl hydrolase [Acidobacteriota bacterium]